VAQYAAKLYTELGGTVVAVPVGTIPIKKLIHSPKRAVWILLLYSI
jgi:hypothetical protein